MFLNYFIWLRITDEGSVPEMRIWSILLIKSDLKWCIHPSRSLFLYSNTRVISYRTKCPCLNIEHRELPYMDFVTSGAICISQTLLVNFADINECRDRNGGCSDLCINTPGSFSCGCDPGYVLLPDHRSCGGKHTHRRNPQVKNYSYF